jgi:hypothetical protein
VLHKKKRGDDPQYAQQAWRGVGIPSIEVVHSCLLRLEQRWCQSTHLLSDIFKPNANNCVPCQGLIKGADAQRLLDVHLFGNADYPAGSRVSGGETGWHKNRLIFGFSRQLSGVANPAHKLNPRLLN